ncbi:MAG: UDP-N-acetylmuramate--L-alanine ligase [Armatimonadota bacterium]
MTHATAQFNLDMSRRHHFVGIGGIGMSAIARILLARGVRVSGSDAKSSPLLTRLGELGAEVSVGHDGVHVHPGDVLVLSDAIKPENPEWRRAVELGLPIVKRADVLGYLVNSARGVAVSGTHGKTTTSGMLALMFLAAGMDPTCVLGGELSVLGSNARPGGPLTLVEACEAYNSFLDLCPEAAIITNIEVDHLDFHGTAEHLYDSFRQFLRQVRSLAVLNGDDPVLRSFLAGGAELPPHVITYGGGEDSDYRITEMRLGAEPAFTLRHGGRALGEFTLRVPGVHNVSNAAGAAALALEMGAELEAVREALARFPGMHRRFERMGCCGPVAVVDDYAHHPTEIRATLAAAREAFDGRIVVLFQPHMYSRTRDLEAEFAIAFDQADAVLVAPIYAARELPIPGVDHRQLAAHIAARIPGVPVIPLSSLDEAVTVLAHATGTAGEEAQNCVIPALQNGDVIITVGAGDVDSVAQTLVGLGGACKGPAMPSRG